MPLSDHLLLSPWSHAPSSSKGGTKKVKRRQRRLPFARIPELAHHALQNYQSPHLNIQNLVYCIWLFLPFLLHHGCYILGRHVQSSFIELLCIQVARVTLIYLFDMKTRMILLNLLLNQICLLRISSAALNTVPGLWPLGGVRTHNMSLLNIFDTDHPALVQAG